MLNDIKGRLNYTQHQQFIDYC